MIKNEELKARLFEFDFIAFNALLQALQAEASDTLGTPCNIQFSVSDYAIFFHFLYDEGKRSVVQGVPLAKIAKLENNIALLEEVLLKAKETFNKKRDL